MPEVSMNQSEQILLLIERNRWIGHEEYSNFKTLRRDSHLPKNELVSRLIFLQEKGWIIHSEEGRGHYVLTLFGKDKALALLNNLHSELKFGPAQKTDI